MTDKTTATMLPFQPGKTFTSYDISCEEAKRLIVRIVREETFESNELIQAMEHTRECRSCGEYFQLLKKH